MTDLSTTIAPKSDQLNCDDLIAGPRTVRVTKVEGGGTREQPISIFFEGDNGKPYKPCLSMRRVLVQLWGKDGSAYVGRSMTLYRDPAVQFGGLAVGGIRISHLSHIDAPVTMALTATRATRKPFTVKPLADVPSSDLPARRDAAKAALQNANTIVGLEKVWGHAKTKALLAELDPDSADELTLTYESRLSHLKESA